MGVFVSWAIEHSLSHRMALHIKEWLPNVFVGQIECFVSSTDISAGSVWLQELFLQLENSQAGIVCVTRDSMTRGWMLFETGALAKMIGSQTQRVCPLLLDLDPGELQYPLAAFQWKQIKPDDEDASKESVFALVKMLNETIESAKRLDERRLEAQFQAFWPQFWDYFKEQRTTHNQMVPAGPVQVDNNNILVELRAGFRQITDLLAQGQRIEMTVSCPGCGTNSVVEFYNAAGATRHITCTNCKARFIAHLDGSRHVQTKALASMPEGSTVPFSASDSSKLLIAVVCPSCSSESLEQFTNTPGATRHLTCSNCSQRFIAHRTAGGAIVSKQMTTKEAAPDSFESFLKRTIFWIDADKTSAMIKAVHDADMKMNPSGAIKNLRDLANVLIALHPEFAKKQVKVFIKILLHGSAFEQNQTARSVTFYTKAFYRGIVKRLRGGFNEIGGGDLSQLQQALQTANIPGADEALAEALNEKPNEESHESENDGHDSPVARNENTQKPVDISASAGDIQGEG